MDDPVAGVAARLRLAADDSDDSDDLAIVRHCAPDDALERAGAPA